MTGQECLFQPKPLDRTPTYLGRDLALGVSGMPCCEAVKIRYGPDRGNRNSKPTASSRDGVGRKV